MDIQIWPELKPVERIEKLNFMVECDLEKIVDKHNVRDIKGYEDLQGFRFTCLSLALIDCSMYEYTQSFERFDEKTKARYHAKWEAQQELLRDKLPLSLADDVINFAEDYGFYIVRFYATLWKELSSMNKDERDAYFHGLKCYVNGYRDEKGVCVNFREAFCTMSFCAGIVR